MPNTKLMIREALRHLPLEPKDVAPMLAEDKHKEPDAKAAPPKRPPD